MTRQQLAQLAMYAGAFTALGSVFAELKTAATWSEVLTPAHVFGALGAMVGALGAFWHPAPGDTAQ